MSKLTSKQVADIIEKMEINNAVAYCNNQLGAETKMSDNGVVEAVYATSDGYNRFHFFGTLAMKPYTNSYAVRPTFKS